MNLVAQVADLVNAAVAGRVELDQIEQAALGDGIAEGALVARSPGRVRVETVDGFGQQPRRRRLARAARAGKEVRVADASRDNRVAQGTCDVPLAHHRVKGLR